MEKNGRNQLDRPGLRSADSRRTEMAGEDLSAPYAPARSRRTRGKRCLLLVFVVCVIKLTTLVFLLPFVQHRNAVITATGINSAGSGTDDVKPGSFQAPINEGKIQKVLKYMNMTPEEGRRNLPLTLTSPLLFGKAELCGGSNRKDFPVDLLFVVHTSPVNFRRRLQMRNTIMKEENFKPHKVRVAFLLGRVNDSSLQDALDYEHDLYRDTVQGDFLDSYRNLSHKGILGFRWASQHCPNARYVVKMDDDVFFDTYKTLLRYRGVFEGRQRTILCNLWVRDTMPVYRNDSKWTVGEKQFRGLTAFPFDYCSGLAVMMTGDLVPLLFRAAFSTPVFWIDDIYLFGMLPWVVGGITMIDLGHQHRYVTMNTTEALSCMRTREHACPVLATSCYSHDDWDSMWNITFRLHVDTNWSVPYITVE